MTTNHAEKAKSANRVFVGCVSTLMVMPMLNDVCTIKLLAHAGPEWAPTSHRYAKGISA